MDHKTCESIGSAELELPGIFRLLLEHFGPRKWWPAQSAFEVVIGAILTQSVSWANVEKAMNKLKTQHLLSVRAMYEIDIDELAALIKSTRYYNQKALKIKSFVNMLVEEFDGGLEALLLLEIDELRQKLLSIKGIGKETADSIILYAANKPIFVVDSYTKRIFSRLGLIAQRATYEDTQDLFHDNLKKDVYLFNEYHALIVCLGHNICLANNPRCPECPILDYCNIHRKPTPLGVG